MTKSDLIKYSVKDVKINKTLFAEYLRIYEDEFGHKPACGSCSFANTFNQWKKTPIIIKLKTMSTKNTFKLKNENKRFRLPENPTLVLGKTSTDEVALLYINGEKGKFKEEREFIFKVLPKVEVVEKKAVVEIIVVEDVKDVALENIVVTEKKEVKKTKKASK